MKTALHVDSRRQRVTDLRNGALKELSPAVSRLSLFRAWGGGGMNMPQSPVFFLEQMLPVFWLIFRF